MTTAWAPPLLGLLIAVASAPIADDPAGRRQALAWYATEHEGDPARGRAVFADPGGAWCARCHRVGKDGGEVGPDLSAIGGKFGRQGGALHFGGDGMLYIAIGDQTAGEPAQRLDIFQGKMLRIRPDGSIPGDNPFALRARGHYRAIWAIGLRNPFAFAVRPGTGRIFANDMGQDAWEEIDDIVAGGNYGGPAAEGPSGDARFRPPIHSYKVASITGGAFVPEGAFPAEYRGRYLFMDFVQGWIRSLDPGHPAEASPFVSGLPRPVDLAFAPDGSLYVLARDAWVIDDKFRPHTGSLFQIRFEGRN